MSHFDAIVIGSGFGGSVSALRLSEKGYRVLVIEKGKRYGMDDFPKSNWDLKRWMWRPEVGLNGIFQMSFLEHVTVMHGVGVGGGSLVYANTLPTPKDPFFQGGSWASLADWKKELAPHYATARKYLGSARNPLKTRGDEVLEEIAADIGRSEHFHLTDVGVYFGQPGVTAKDPYFGGEGPDRTGCTHCGACMTGCRHNAKNTLDKNYLHLAQQLGTEILAEHEVFDVKPQGKSDGSDGYTVHFRPSTRFFKPKKTLRAKGVIFAGGVLGTVKLLLNLKKSSLPNLSDRVGQDIRTNNESLIAITSLAGKHDLSKGVAIGAILHTDPHSHLEICRYGAGSGAWRLAFLPFVDGKNALVRFGKIVWETLTNPLTYLKYFAVKDWAKSSVVLLFMQTLDSTVTFTRSRWGGMRTTVSGTEKPTAFIPRAIELARKFEKILRGKAMAFGLTPLAGIPGTAHILGGAVMGDGPDTGVIDRDNRVFGYENLLVCDGAMISANPGVNPSLSITAIAERAMSGVAEKPVEGNL